MNVKYNDNNSGGNTPAYTNSIARKLIIAIILFSSVITLLATALQLFLDYQHDVKLIDANIDQVRITNLPSIVNSVWNYDDLQINHQLEGLQRIPDIEYLEILVDGAPRWSAGDKRSRFSVSSRFPLEHHYRGQDVLIGEMNIIASLDSVYERLMNKAIVILISNGIKTFLVAGFMFFIFRYLVTQHLELLAKYMRNLDFKKSHIPVKLNRSEHEGKIRDELDQLSFAINELGSNLHDSYNALKVAHDNLEEKVEERTQQLKDKNEELTTLSNKLSKYLSPQVYSSIFTGQQEVQLGSRRKKVSILFADIVGFTSATDRMEPEDITYILNEYLTEMTNIALTNGGTIDKYIGDAIMLFFGDPESQGVKNDAVACVKTGLEMHRRQKELGEKWRKEGINMPIKTRIGIHTGYATVGNFGSDERMDYTIIGGAVNLASRLEHSADPGGILISADTHVLVEDAFVCEPRGSMEIRGIAYPVETYSITGAKT